ncbi:thioredoxin family protein [Nonomuraea sediminis]|uniref:thioredoxin family protein n=1 Tax=Nonomuraea sediminis TaxID=2835864 RepID=UPI001BDC0C7B|nr:thioredoxin family protein [Nonomuraea sediminis]
MTISDLTEQGRPVLVDFWAPGCARCRSLRPVLEELAERYGDRVAFTEVDAHAEAELAARYGVMRLPTVLIVRDGQVTTVLSGSGGRAELEAALDAIA